MIPSNTRLLSKGFLPAPGLLRYVRRLSRCDIGSSGFTRSQNASETSHDFGLGMEYLPSVVKDRPTGRQCGHSLLGCQLFPDKLLVFGLVLRASAWCYTAGTGWALRGKEHHLSRPHAACRPPHATFPMQLFAALSPIARHRLERRRLERMAPGFCSRVQGIVARPDRTGSLPRDSGGEICGGAGRIAMPGLQMAGSLHRSKANPARLFASGLCARLRTKTIPGYLNRCASPHGPPSITFPVRASPYPAARPGH